MGGQGSQRKFYSHTAKGKAVALVEPRSRKDASESAPAMERESVLVHGDFRESPSRNSPRRPFFIRGKVRLFGHFVPLQFLLLALVESLAFAGITLLTLFSLGADGGSSQQPLLEMAPKALTIAFLLTLSLGALGLYSAHQRADVAGVLSRALVARARYRCWSKRPCRFGSRFVAELWSDSRTFLSLCRWIYVDSPGLGYRDREEGEVYRAIKAKVGQTWI